jgi:hypothetical protein
MHKTKIAILANYFAVFCMLLLNSWLILNHGHKPENSLLQHYPHDTSRVIISSIHCHDTRDNKPLYEDHALWQSSFSQCLICIFYQGNFTDSENSTSNCADLPETFQTNTPETDCYTSPAFSFHLRAPPFQA